MSPNAQGLMIYIRVLGNASGHALKEMIVDTFTLEMMFHMDITPGPVIWYDLRKFLQQRNVLLTVQERHRAVFTVANNIFDDPDEKNRTLLDSPSTHIQKCTSGRP